MFAVSSHSNKPDTTCSSLIREVLARNLRYLAFVALFGSNLVPICQYFYKNRVLDWWRNARVEIIFGARCYLCPTSRATATNWARTCASSPTLSVTVVANRIKAPWVRISRNLWTQIVRFHRVPIQVSPRGPQFRFCAFKWGLHKFFQGDQ